MNLFNFNKKKNEVSSDCCCGNNETTSKCCHETEEISNIKVLGSGCKTCHKLFENVKEAVSNTNISVEYVTDMETIMQYGVMSMPALVVNEKVVSTGKLLSVVEVINLIRG